METWDAARISVIPSNQFNHNQKKFDLIVNLPLNYHQTIKLVIKLNIKLAFIYHNVKIWAQTETGSTFSADISWIYFFQFFYLKTN